MWKIWPSNIGCLVSHRSPTLESVSRCNYNNLKEKIFYHKKYQYIFVKKYENFWKSWVPVVSKNLFELFNSKELMYKQGRKEKEKQKEDTFSEFYQNVLQHVFTIMISRVLHAYEWRNSETSIIHSKFSWRFYTNCF